MGLVLFALKYRVTFYVLAVFILLAGGGAAVVMRKDVLPEVSIPVVNVLWTYTGLDAPDMQNYVTSYEELAISNNVVGVRDLESTTLQGITLTKIYFYGDTDISLALSQVTAATNDIIGLLPAGIQPPVVLRFDASSVPVIQLAVTSDTEDGAEIYDYTRFRIRPVLQTLHGSTIPPPYGGVPEQAMIDLDLNKLNAFSLTPQNVLNAIDSQSVVLPSGLAKFGDTQFVMRINSTPPVLQELNDIPIVVRHGQPILIRDIGWVRAGGPPQQNAVHVNGKQGVLLTILKNGPTSTLTLTGFVKDRLPAIRAAAPKDLKVIPLFDQSGFVSDSIDDVVREGVIAAGLTGLMILLFLGSWRATLVVLVSIPLAILSSLAVLALLGETINIMTLGGLALAVGILVDDATVAIENTYRLLEEKKPFREAVAHGAAGIAKPALISTLAICSAFISVLFLDGAAKFIFTPQALAVVFAMLASYLLSRTLVPILIDVLCASEQAAREKEHEGGPAEPKGRYRRFRDGFERNFERFHGAYIAMLTAAIEHRRTTLAIAGGTVALAGVVFLNLGRDYFPQISAPSMTLHVRARPGLRIEDANRLFQRVEDTIREVVPPSELGDVVDNIGLPPITYNLAFNDGTFVAYNDGQILATLKPGANTFGYQHRLRTVLHERFPDTVFYFQPADTITQILDFGVPSQIDVQVTGRNKGKDLAVAKDIVHRLSLTTGVVDAHLQQIVDAPEFYTKVDRERAEELGLTETQVADDINVAMSGSFQVKPILWTNPKTGIPWELWVQAPEYRLDTLGKVENTPLQLAGAAGGPMDLFSNVATFHRGTEESVGTRINSQGTYDAYAAVQDSDLGTVADKIDRIVADERKGLKAPDKILVRGQIQSMNDAFFHIGIGLAMAIIAVYLLMVLNYQDWLDPFVVLCALPMVFSGVVLGLFISGTTFSIPSLMGAIMSVGVASANSILLITFAREHRDETGCSAGEAAIAAGETRLRPVLMTAGAMFVGLIPMSLALGEGSEANAALARAVMGGIAVGTCSTLLFVPFLYSVLRTRPSRPPEDYI